MALDGTYAGLKSAIASWLKRSDLTSSIPDFVDLAEARIARDFRLRAQVTFGTLTTTGGADYVSLPADFLEIENISIEGSIERPLTYETPEQIDVRFPLGSGQSKPAVYTIIGDRLYLAPCPDSDYTVKFTYYARFPALSADADTNWLLAKHPTIYLFAALAEAAPFLMNDDRAPMWEAKYQSDKSALDVADDQSLRSGSALRVRAVV